jgi:hypothetical protein
VDTDIVTLAGGALVALVLIAGLLFHRVRGNTPAERLLGWSSKLGFAATFIGWLIMWFTEGAIWSPLPRSCAAFASIELKGQVFRNCSYLIHRYQVGEWLFFGGLAAIAACFALGRLVERQT